jgi:HNH endonuclease
MMKTCTVCGRPSRQSRCELHRIPPSSGTSSRNAARVRAAAITCHLCGLPFTANDPPVADHVIARGIGGSDNPGNLRAAHQSCRSQRTAARQRRLELPKCGDVTLEEREAISAMNDSVHPGPQPTGTFDPRELVLNGLDLASKVRHLCIVGDLSPGVVRHGVRVIMLERLGKAERLRVLLASYEHLVQPGPQLHGLLSQNSRLGIHT